MIDFGLKQEEFFSNYFESRLYLKRHAFDASEIKWSLVNDAIYVSEAFSNTKIAVKIHCNGFVPEAEFVEYCLDHGLLKRKIKKSVLHRLLREGATLIFDRIETVSDPIRRLCNQVSRYVGEEVVANGYVAFGEKESFGVHWDTHDVFVIQMIGRKHWRIFPPTFPLPLPGQTSKLHKAECPTHAVFDDILDAGDILYIPKGWWHTAIPVNEESFHIAVGIHCLSVIDYVKWIADSVLPDAVECRRALHYAGDAYDRIEAVTEKIGIALKDRENYLRFQKSRQQRERVDSLYTIERCLTRRRIESMEHTEISFNSKNTAMKEIVAADQNPFEMSYDEEMVLRWLARRPEHSSFHEIVAAFPNLCAESIQEILIRLAIADAITIHE